MQSRRPTWLQFRTRAAERNDCILQHGRHFRRRRGDRIVDHIAHPKIPEALMARWRKLPFPCFCVPAFRTSQYFQRRQQVARASRHRSRHGEQRRKSRCPQSVACLVPSLADQVQRRFVPVDAAEIRRHANRSADVASHAQEPQPRRQCRRRTSRTPARCPLKVPGIVRGSVDRVVALPVMQIQRDIRGADQHRARAQQPIDGRRVSRSLHVLERGNSERGRPARHREAFLHAHRHAVKRAGRFALGQ